MKVRYILGASGCGKFTTCVNEIIKSQEKEPNKKVIFIVPEQFSAYTESVLINNTKSKVLLNTQVLSFKRLAYHIFSEIGASKKVILEDCGQVMILRKILHNIYDELLYFNSVSYNNLGLIEKIISVIEEFFEYNVTLEKLDEILNSNLKNENENLFFKIHDLKIIYEKYLDYLHKDYITSSETLDILANNLKKSNLIKDAEIWIYGFFGFTQQELNVISELSKKVQKINIALSLNTKNINIKELYTFDPFFEVKNTIKKLEKIITQNNLILEEVLYLDENKRHLNNEELKHLEKNYFSYNPALYKKDIKNIEISSFNNKYLEVENVAKKIITLVRDFDYKFKDIAIVISDTSYDKTINFIFNKYGIPYFLDFKKTVKTHPLTYLVCSALDTIIYNWNYNSVFQYLKTDFILGYGDDDFKITRDDINALENYVIAYGIKNSKWKEKCWKYGFGDNSVFNEAQINKTKELVCKSLKSLNFNKNKTYSVKEISTKIMDFLMELDVLKSLEDRVVQDKEFLELNNYSDTSKFKEHHQVWNSIILILEKFVEILGDDKVTIEEYSKILKTGLEKSEIALYPLTQDQVVIGDFHRTRFPKVKAMFVLSVNEGVIPAFKDDTSFISDTEKVTLMSKGIEISPDSVQLLCQENFYIYSIITKPTEKLFLSYLTSDLDGQSKKPSFVIQRVLQLFEGLKVHSSEENFSTNNKNFLTEIYTPKATFEKIFESINLINQNELNKETLIFKDILSWFLQNDNYKEKLNAIQNGLKTLSPQNYLTKDVISKIYKNNMVFSSVSKLEKFNSCPFSYFLQYNLKVNERKIYQIDSLEVGLFYHDVLEKFSSLVFNDEVDYKNLGHSQIDSYIDLAVEQYLASLDTDIFSSSKRYNYFLEKVKRISKLSAYALIKQLRKGSFVPYGFEVEFTSSSNDYNKENIFTPIVLDLSNNYKMFLTGKIDRVDLLEDKDNLYIKILDYKSSDKKVDILSVYYGLQLQLLMYMDVFIKFNELKFSDKNILPAGLFYFRLNDPILKFDKKTTISTLGSEIYKSFNIKGLYSDDKVVMKGLDLNFDKDTSKKISGISSSTPVTQEQFTKLRNFVNVLSKELGTEITNGNIKINPYKIKNTTSCKYCPYKSICNIEILSTLDTAQNDYGYKILKDIKQDEVWKLIDKKLE